MPQSTHPSETAHPDRSLSSFQVSTDVPSTVSRHRPKRILFVHSSNELYGADVSLLAVLNNLDRQRFEPLVVLPSDVPYEGRLSAVLRRMGITHWSIKMGVLRRRYFNPLGAVRYFAYLIYGIWELARLTRKYQVDLIHSNTSAVLGGAVVARLFGLPHVWHVREILTKPGWLVRLINKFIHANSTCVIAVSQAVACHLSKHGGNSIVRVILNSVDCKSFGPWVDGRHIRDCWGIKSGEVVIGQVGRISRWKGQELMIEAVVPAIEMFPQLRFVFVGDPVPGDEARLADLQARAHHLGLEDKISFVPFNENAPQVMRALDILVLSSMLPEPLGLVVLEAMASERPVIAAAHGGPLETIEDGVTGLLFPPGNARALAEAIVELARDPERRNDMGSKGRQRVLDYFNVENREIASLYFDLLDKQ